MLIKYLGMSDSEWAKLVQLMENSYFLTQKVGLFYMCNSILDGMQMVLKLIIILSMNGDMFWMVAFPYMSL